MSAKPINNLLYEEAFNELDEVISTLEAGDHTLAETLSLFEHGQALARHCARLLEQAELKVQQLQEEQLTEFTTTE